MVANVANEAKDGLIANPYLDSVSYSISINSHVAYLSVVEILNIYHPAYSTKNYISRLGLPIFKQLSVKYSEDILVILHGGGRKQYRMTTTLIQ